jgi:hypothetical protein
VCILNAVNRLIIVIPQEEVKNYLRSLSIQTKLITRAYSVCSLFCVMNREYL